MRCLRWVGSTDGVCSRIQPNTAATLSFRKNPRNLGGFFLPKILTPLMQLQPFSKPSLSYQQQVQKLQSNGMSVCAEEDAIKTLLNPTQLFRRLSRSTNSIKNSAAAFYLP